MMLDNRFVEEYRKIKPTEELKARILESTKEAKTPARKPLYKRLKPVLSGAVACALLVLCITVMPLELLGGGDVSVMYSQSGELIAPSSAEFRIAPMADMEYEYGELDGSKGAEFTFLLDGKTEFNTDFGTVYTIDADGSQRELGNKFRIDGSVKLFWAIPDGDEVYGGAMSMRNRDGEWVLSLSLADGGYTADLIRVR